MKCPACENSTLAITERRGIEIDYCPQCRGVWLDRGELDKLIEKSADVFKDRETHYGSYTNKKYDYDDNADNAKYFKQKKRKGLLGELFDF